MCVKTAQKGKRRFHAAADGVNPLPEGRVPLPKEGSATAAPPEKQPLESAHMSPWKNYGRASAVVLVYRVGTGLTMTRRRTGALMRTAGITWVTEIALLSYVFAPDMLRQTVQHAAWSALPSSREHCCLC